MKRKWNLIFIEKSPLMVIGLVTYYSSKKGKRLINNSKICIRLAYLGIFLKAINMYTP